MMIMLSLLMVIPFGWQAAIANFFLDVSVDATPIGSWKVHLINPPTSAQLGTPVPPMMHAVHGNPQAIRILGDWIEQRGLEFQAGCRFSRDESNMVADS